MTLTKIAAITMLIAWPVGMFYGYTLFGALHVMLAASLVAWLLQANPLDAKRPKRAVPRQVG
jgi:uncharacterized protein (DUF58 family)